MHLCRLEAREDALPEFDEAGNGLGAVAAVGAGGLGLGCGSNNHVPVDGRPHDNSLGELRWHGLDDTRKRDIRLEHHEFTFPRRDLKWRLPVHCLHFIPTKACTIDHHTRLQRQALSRAVTTLYPSLSYLGHPQRPDFILSLIWSPLYLLLLIMCLC